MKPHNSPVRRTPSAFKEGHFKECTGNITIGHPEFWCGDIQFNLNGSFREALDLIVELKLAGYSVKHHSEPGYDYAEGDYGAEPTKGFMDRHAAYLEGLKK